MPQMGPLHWMGIVLSSWAILILFYSFFSPPVLKEPPLPPLTLSLLSLPW